MGSELNIQQRIIYLRIRILTSNYRFRRKYFYFGFRYNAAVGHLKYHVCGAYLNFATLEHMDALKSQGKNAAIEFCKARFPINNFSDTNYRSSRVTFSRLYKSKLSLTSHFLRAKSKAMFLQSPYEEHYPDWFEGLDSEIGFAYSGYSINLADYYQGTYGSAVVKKSRYLLAGSHDELIGYSKVARPDAVVLLTGNPLLFQLRKVIAENQSRPKKSAKVLWAPHWTKSWQDSSEGFARWETTLGAIFSFARKNPDKEIVFRPHPLLRSAIDVELGKKKTLDNRESIKTQKSDSFKILSGELREFLKLKNVRMSKGTMLQDVYQSDLLITEGLSIIAYWATTGKPILVIRDSKSPGFNREGELLLTKIDQANEIPEILSWLNSNSTTNFLDVNRELISLSNSIHPTFNKSPLKMIVECM